MSSLEGTQFGSYHLQRLLGSGGMSEVYLAYDEATNREVAVKVMAGNNNEYLERFRREAEAIEKLHHPHILSAFDYDEQELWHYLVMPHIPGGTLRNLLDVQGPLSLETTGEILSQIADALQYAHDHGILHRDIKPSNILLQQPHYPYHIYLCDFGLAKILADHHELTQELTLTGALMGTPEYMAPDLANGPASVATDIYALGIVLYQMLTGSVPFNGPTSIAVYWKHLREEPLPPSYLNPDLSSALDQVVLRALAKDPHYRYHSAHALAEAYTQALQHNEVMEEIILADVAEASFIDTAANPFSYVQDLPVYENNAKAVEVLLAEALSPYPEVKSAEERPSSSRRPNKRSSEVETTLARARRVGRRVISRRSQRSAQDIAVVEERNTPPLSQLPLVLPPLPMRHRREERVLQPDSLMDMPDILNVPVPAHKIPRRASRRSEQRTRHDQRLVIGIVALGVFLFAVLPLSIFSYLYLTHPQTATIRYDGQANTTIPQHQTTPAPAQAKGVILQDSLTNNTPGRWTEDGTHCSFTGGAYVVSASQDGSIQPCMLLSPLVSNASVQADVALQTGTSTGMLLRRNGDQFYDFEINNLGQFFFRRHDTSGTSYAILLAPKTSSAIVPGSAKNTLRVNAQWNDFKLYINGTFVGEVHDALYASGQLAFVTSSSSVAAEAEASYSNLLITQNG
jgi:eukaryotic-like serine/threonine-protein kinase